MISEESNSLAALQQEFLLVLERAISLEQAEHEFYRDFYHVFNFEELSKIKASIIRQENFIGNRIEG